MQQKVQSYIERQQLLTPKARVIVGVSGGTDSVVLLHILHALGYECVVAHCNFHLRMEESNRDEEFVRALSKTMKLPFYNIDFDTVSYADRHGISIEMAARDLRYEWFHDLLKKLDAEAIAVAHHADDSIETMLMNLVRGTGLRGLSGIRPRNKKVIRPLLCCNRQELENYLIRYDLEHVEDSTNASVDYQRNKFRNEVLPLLEEINPSLRQTLYESLKRFEGTTAIYAQAIDAIREKIAETTDGLTKLNIDIIKQQVHIPTVMYEILHPFGFSGATIEQVTENLDAVSGKTFYSDTHRLIKDRKYLIISPKDDDTVDEYYITQPDAVIDQPFGLELKTLKLTSDFSISRSAKRVHIDASKLAFPLQLRRWREGDVFYPFGMKQRKKVSDFFIDNKLSLLEKEQSWLLVSGNDIVWIVGQRLDDRFRITAETTEVVELSING